LTKQFTFDEDSLLRSLEENILRFYLFKLATVKISCCLGWLLLFNTLKIRNFVSEEFDQLFQLSTNTVRFDPPVRYNGTLESLLNNIQPSNQNDVSASPKKSKIIILNPNHVLVSLVSSKTQAFVVQA
jgi:hypothetical protein